ncbi:MAG: hypothetical protein KGH49_03890 [Candidatus Micrarchaeota archaeon]|nr:hypothetical protein [Candidatus Micrarchaeota archaeon]
MKAIAPLIIILIILLIGAGTVATYYVYATSNPAPSLPNLSGSTNSSIQSLASSPLYKSLSSQTNVNIANLSQTPTGALGTLQYNITYLGKISASVNVGGVSLPVIAPLAITNLRYANDSKLAISLSGVPVIGSVNASFVKLGNTIYTCSQQDLLNKSSGYVCSAKSDANVTNLTLYYLATGINATVNNVYPSEFDGTPCIFLNSSFAIPLSKVGPYLGQLSFLNGILNVSSINGVNGVLQSCVSPASNLPLTAYLALYLSQPSTTTTVILSLSEVGIGGPVSDSSITTLPGPVR